MRKSVLALTAAAAMLAGGTILSERAGAMTLGGAEGVRGALDTISLHYGGRRVLILTHQVVVLCMRYLLENLTEDEILAIDRQGDVANCAVTEYRYARAPRAHSELVLERYNFVAPLEHAGAPVTAAPDRIAGAR